MDWINPRRNFESFSIQPGRGLNISFDGSGTETIPTLEGGQVPKYIYVCIYGPSSVQGVFALGGTLPSEAETLGGWKLSLFQDCAETVCCTGYTEFSWLKAFGPSTARLTIYPLADF
jgi:hypothetical protein